MGPGGRNVAIFVLCYRGFDPAVYSAALVVSQATQGKRSVSHVG